MSRNRKRMAGDIFKVRQLKQKLRRVKEKSRPAAGRPDFDYKKKKNNKQLNKDRQMLTEANDKVSNMIRYGDDDVQRSGWTDAYNDDGKIKWSTTSAKGTRERKQERRTMRFLERQTGLDFKRTNANSGKAEIEINRYDDSNYFNKYKGKDWYDNFGFTPSGLHHWEQDGNRRYSRIEAPTRNARHDSMNVKGKSQKTLSHEIGHALGLTDLFRSQDQKAAGGYSVMSYNTNHRAPKGPVRFGLSDINAIKMNYGLS